VVQEAALRRNCATLAAVRARTGCKIMLALKAFAMWRAFPIVREYLDGICASGPFEARLGREEFGGEVHVFAPAYSAQDMDELVAVADHLVFNSCAQWRRHRVQVQGAARAISCGWRVNPEHSEAPAPKYSPCGPHSRLGMVRAQLDETALDGISGLHFHALCEQNADAFARTLQAFEQKFGDLVPRMHWINFGGGHHITREDYDLDLLCRLLTTFRDKYGTQELYLEPGEAVALNAGVLVASVQDVIYNEMPLAILDTSASAHMPDVLEMPYRPTIVGAGAPGELAHTYRLGGLTCLAGDVIGDYSFAAPLQPGDRLVFTDMAHYSFVKTTMFNGVRHPALALEHANDALEIVRAFTYEDFKQRLS
jgi:carboxynorspermidine decarboxylase